jgi:alkylation response protein AidB-like acyl-CoA dehydrogenase
MTSPIAPPTLPVDEEEFVVAAHTFLTRHAEPRRPTTQRTWGEGSDAVDAMGVHGDDDLDAVIRWRRTLFDGGFGWISGPTRYGGAGLSQRHEELFARVLARFEAPDQTLFQVSRGMVSPAILEHGADDLKQRFLPGIHRGDIVCSQLLSEPEAGSDLAGLRTTARRDGDEWVVNGQKVWNSYAHIAQAGQLLARTDPDVPKHQGLTMFMLPMDTPGITVRPLRQMNGQAEFNEVFFDDVRVADANRVGDVGGGWRAILTTLMNERHVVANRGGSSMVPPAERVFELAAHVGATNDSLVRQRLADVHVHDEILRYLRLRLEQAAVSGRPPGPEGSIAKLVYTTQLRRIGELAADLLGPAFIADTGEWGTFTWSRFFCGSPGLRIAGGTDEIQRNTIAERQLGLPKEPKPDRPSGGHTSAP